MASHRNTIRGLRILQLVAVLTVVLITGCATYKWSNHDRSLHNRAQLDRDIGECTLLAWQTTPAILESTRINQSISLYGSGYSSSDSGLSYEERRAPDKQRGATAISCMYSKGWYKDTTD
jgi:hypothetical protein